MGYSAATWAFDWETPCVDAINSIANLGFHGIELRIQGTEELKYYNNKTNKSLRELIDHQGLKVTNLNYTPTGASSPNSEERKLAVKDFETVVDVAQQLGTDLITLGPSYPGEMTCIDEHYRPSMQVWNMNIPEGLDLAMNFEEYVDTVRRFAKLCQDHNLKLAFETVPYAWARNTDAVLRLLEQPGLENVGVTYDVANISMIGEVAEIFVYRLNKRIFNVQMADNHGTNNAHWRPGKGKNNFNAIVRALADVGYKGPVCLELSDTEGAGRTPKGLYNPHGNYEKLYRSHKLAIAELERIYHEEGL